MLRYRVLSGNIGVISEFENRQSRQFCMKTTMNVEKARREAMHMSWKVHDIERFSSLKWAITNTSSFIIFLSSFRKLGLKSGFTRSCGFSSENGCFSYVDFVSFSKIQSNDALPRGGGICGNAHMRKRDSRVENGRFSYVDFVSFLENQSNFALQISFAHMSASINTPSWGRVG